MYGSILAPAATLVVWSLIMMFWMVAVRLPALKRAGIDMSTNIGGRGQDLEGVIDARANWKAHNYNHLMEQPTLFYATIAILAIAGEQNEIMIGFAWGYVVFRILHSIWQSTVNSIKVRFPLFLAATICLIVLAIRALIVAWQ